MEAVDRRSPESGWIGRSLGDWPRELLPECRRVGGAAFRPELNVYATLAHHPHALVAWVELGRTASEEAGLAPADRERVILWTAARFGGKYPFARHSLLARGVGIDSAEIRRLSQGKIDGWPIPVPDDPGRVVPLVRFYAAASFMLEALRTPPDADVVSEWPDWQRPTSWRTGLNEIDRLGRSRSTAYRTAVDRLVTVLVDERELPVPAWNGVIHATRQKFQRNILATHELDGPVNRDAEAVRFVVNANQESGHQPAQRGPGARASVEAVLLAVATGILAT